MSLFEITYRNSNSCIELKAIVAETMGDALKIFRKYMRVTDDPIKCECIEKYDNKIFIQKD